MQQLAVPLRASDPVVWRRATSTATSLHKPDTQNVLARLDAVVDRLEGAFQQWERLEPLLEQYADDLLKRRKGGGDGRA